MQELVARIERIPKLSRFGWLMALYAENFRRVTRLFEPADLGEGGYLSSIGDGVDVRLDVLHQHAYTTELRLTYTLRDPLTGEPDPSAYLRLYRDARQLEATHCYVGRLDHRLRLNTFLGKWVQYLAEQGHGVATLRTLPAEAGQPLSTED
jgi:uncharacterized protein YqiB (DUF1249 family)